MRALRDMAERERSRRAFERVFASMDFLDAPFQNSVERRLILFPTGLEELEKQQFEALGGAAFRLGDREAFVTSIKPGPEGWSEDAYFHGITAFDDSAYASYSSSETAPALLEHALYSPQGAWGLLTSDAEHAVVGGPTDFIEDLLSAIPRSEDEMLEEWLDYWRRFHAVGTDVSWLPANLTHLLGHDRALQALKRWWPDLL